MEKVVWTGTDIENVLRSIHNILSGIVTGDVNEMLFENLMIPPSAAEAVALLNDVSSVTSVIPPVNEFWNTVIFEMGSLSPDIKPGSVPSATGAVEFSPTFTHVEPSYTWTEFSEVLYWMDPRYG